MISWLRKPRTQTTSSCRHQKPNTTYYNTHKEKKIVSLRTYSTYETNTSYYITHKEKMAPAHDIQQVVTRGGDLFSSLNPYTTTSNLKQVTSTTTTLQTTTILQSYTQFPNIVLAQQQLTISRSRQPPTIDKQTNTTQKYTNSNQAPSNIISTTPTHCQHTLFHTLHCVFLHVANTHCCTHCIAGSG